MNPEGEMDRVLAFMRDFIHADYETDKASNYGEGAPRYSRLLQALKRFFDKDLSPGHPLVLPTDLDEETRSALEEQSRELRPRILFKIKKWEHPREGTIYQTYVSSTAPSKERGYFQSLVVKAVQGHFKIVARYAVCLACFATGKHRGKVCPNCSLQGWDYRQGLDLKTFGKPQETRRLEAPTIAAFLPEYES